ncbi:hypothetical protein [Bacillus cereus]|uniref:hypothetical protein n=1 Tax=Bacillus cereus TaxID=1396 RepID=UPI000BFC1510|nr:hypothetical protein [Bacillus cereus]PGU51819.1 hypothetical protein COD72_23010 [Bacillus cereus]
MNELFNTFGFMFKILLVCFSMMFTLIAMRYYYGGPQAKKRVKSKLKLSFSDLLPVLLFGLLISVATYFLWKIYV